MNILLIYPPLNEHTSYWLPHLGLGYLTSILRKNNYKVEVLDMVAERMNFKDFELFLHEKNIDILAITATTYEIMNAHKIAEIAKRKNEKILTIIGGPHSTALPFDTLKEFKHFDIAVIGEGERTMLEVIKRIEAKESLNDIKGIAYRKDGEIKVNERRDYIQNLDEVPFPLWEVFSLKKYRGYLGLFKKIELPIMSGRGCPYQCVFCQRVLGNKIRLRSVKNVVDEIEYSLKCGAKSLAFCDETFTLFKKRTIEICDEIIRRGLNKRFWWHCETRVDKIDKETLMKMKFAGCKLVAFGVESGNDFILQKAKKGITVEQIKKAFKWSKEVGLKTYMFLIFGLPYETEETINDTINLMMELDSDYVTIGILVPFPGTEVFKMAINNEGCLRIKSKNWNMYGKQLGDALELNGLGSEKLKELQMKAYLKFYLRPQRIMNLFELANVKGVYQLGKERLKKFIGR